VTRERSRGNAGLRAFEVYGRETAERAVILCQTSLTRKSDGDWTTSTMRVHAPDDPDAGI
jgi:hypothetical protein